MDREVVSPAGINVGADIRPEEETLVEENARIAFLAIGSGTFGVEMMEVKVLDFTGVSPAAESIYKDVRNAGDTRQVDMVTALDYLYRLVGVHEFFHSI